MERKTTETLDKLYLEWSQFTTARIPDGTTWEAFRENLEAVQ